MIKRLLNIPDKHSFFLFGPRGSGKTFLLNNSFDAQETLRFDLLDIEVFDRLIARPNDFKDEIERELTNPSRSKPLKWIVVDEVQKLPALLDLVHLLIEKHKLYFALTGSSARKLKRGGANLLAGRAFVLHLFPYLFSELGSRFTLEDALSWGTLPPLMELDNTQDRIRYLNAYVQTYLREEIAIEQVVRKLEPFRKFLEVAAQSDGKLINYSNISRDVGAAVTSVQSYFSILEDTLLGFLLEPFHHSVRKRQKASPKFYFFDYGIVRSLTKSLGESMRPGTYAFGNAFENLVINHIYRLNVYSEKDYHLSFLRTKNDLEIDLIIERPRQKTLCLEIKSTNQVTEREITSLTTIAKDLGNVNRYCLSLDPVAKLINGVECLPWQQGLDSIFG